MTFLGLLTGYGLFEQSHENILSMTCGKNTMISDDGLLNLSSLAFSSCGVFSSFLLTFQIWFDIDIFTKFNRGADLFQ